MSSLKEAYCVATSTGVVNEHSVDEYVPIAPLEQVVKDTLRLLEMVQRSFSSSS